MDQISENSFLQERMYIHMLSSGVKCYIIPKSDSHQAQAAAVFSYGAVDRSFTDRKTGRIVDSPAGTAHFIEHKAFEQSWGDAYGELIKSGAYCNAFTDFNKTAYYFSSHQKFEQSFRLLLQFLQHPVFKEESVEREKEIIKQEIKMYEDDPAWKTYYNVIQSMYASHAVRDSVAGSEESIRLIDRKTLAEFYQAFYRPEFMTLVVTGNVRPEQIVSIAEEELKPKEGQLPGRIDQTDQSDVDTQCKEVYLPLRIPFFTMGFRQTPVGDDALLERVYGTKMLLELLWGEGSRLYQSMYEDGLLTEPPAVQVNFGRSFRFTTVSAKSNQPRRVAQLLWDALYEAKSKEIKARDLERIRKKFMGRLYRRTQSIDACCMDQIDLGVFGMTLFDAFDVVRDMRQTTLEKILREDFCAEARAFSAAGKRG